MSTKKAVKKNSVKKLAGSKAKVKVPKFKLITYTLKAVIPTGQFANIQPEITVQANSIEQAERAVMPYIEAMFAKYRGDGSQVPTVTTTPVKPVAAQSQVLTKPQQTAQAPKEVAKPQEEVKKAPEAPEAPVATVEAPIVLTVPFNRAKGAIESCTSKEALKLVTDQVTKSVKLTPEEKNTLIMLASDKSVTLNG